MKKILIFTAGFGEGHNTAARNIRDALEHIAPDEVKVEVLDLFDTCYGKLNDWVRKAYITAINRTPRVWGKIYNVIDGTQFVEANMVMLAKMKRAMSDVLADLEPDAVVSTYPIYNYVIDSIYADGRPKTFSQITVITDSITVNSSGTVASAIIFWSLTKIQQMSCVAQAFPSSRFEYSGFLSLIDLRRCPIIGTATVRKGLDESFT